MKLCISSPLLRFTALPFMLEASFHLSQPVTGHYVQDVPYHYHLVRLTCPASLLSSSTFETLIDMRTLDGKVAKSKRKTESVYVVEADPPPYMENGGGESLYPNEMKLYTNGRRKVADSGHPPALSMAARLLWPTTLLIPLLTAGTLLYLITCSTVSWRADLAVVKIKLEGQSFVQLMRAGQLLSPDTNKGLKIKNDTSLPSASADLVHPVVQLISLSKIKETVTGDPQTTKSAHSTLMRRAQEAKQNLDSGVLTLGFWGWCVRNVKSGV
jgi:hypothetical protein